MANTNAGQNASGQDDQGQLRGGTEGGGGTSQHTQTGTMPGGNNAVQPSGGQRPKGTNSVPPDREEEGVRRQDPRRTVEGGSRKDSPEAAARQARDEANVPPDVSRSGRDQGNPRQIPPETPTT
jgi:hypothetical protein